MRRADRDAVQIIPNKRAAVATIDLTVIPRVIHRLDGVSRDIMATILSVIPFDVVPHLWCVSRRLRRLIHSYLTHSSSCHNLLIGLPSLTMMGSSHAYARYMQRLDYLLSLPINIRQFQLQCPDVPRRNRIEVAESVLPLLRGIIRRHALHIRICHVPLLASLPPEHDAIKELLEMIISCRVLQRFSIGRPFHVSNHLITLNHVATHCTRWNYVSLMMWSNYFHEQVVTLLKSGIDTLNPSIDIHVHTYYLFLCDAEPAFHMCV